MNSEKLNWLKIVLHERFGYIFSIQYNDQGFLTLCLPNDDVRCISFTTDQITFSRTDSNLPFTHWDSTSEGWQSVLGSPLPAPGATSLPSPLVAITNQGTHISYDILGLTYWMLNRVEEIGRTDLDPHGRFPAAASHAYKFDYLERPVVDEWLYILGQVIQRTWPEIELKNNNFSIKVSHDVDVPSRYAFSSLPRVMRSMAVDIIKRQDFKGAFFAPWVRISTRNQLHRSDTDNTFDWIMDLSEQHGLRSAFYFICGNTHPNDADYQLEHPAMRDLMDRIHRRGHEIGLHPSYGTYQKSELIHLEAERLYKVCAEQGIFQAEWGARMHYLRWEQPTTLRALADVGISYDSTLGYADHAGFRCGTCFEYPAFDHLTKEILPLRIRPLIAMDCTIMSSQYMGLGVSDAALDKLIKLKDTCKSVEGCFTLLWHNSELEIVEKKIIYSSALTSSL